MMIIKSCWIGFWKTRREKEPKGLQKSIIALHKQTAESDPKVLSAVSFSCAAA